MLLRWGAEGEVCSCGATSPVAVGGGGTRVAHIYHLGDVVQESVLQVPGTPLLGQGLVLRHLN